MNQHKYRNENWVVTFNRTAVWGSITLLISLTNASTDFPTWPDLNTKLFGIELFVVPSSTLTWVLLFFYNEKKKMNNHVIKSIDLWIHK